MRPYDIVLWDLDGTVMDSAEGVFLSFEYTFAEMGLVAPDRRDMRRFVGPPLKTTFGDLLGFSPDERARAIALYQREYNRIGAFTAEPFPGVVDLIREVQSAGMTTALATSKAETEARAVTAHFQLDDLFDIYGCATNNDDRKTKAEVLRFIFEQPAVQGIDSSRVVLVGDRIFDVEGAREFGIDCVLVEWGYGTPEEFAAATASVATVSELRRFLGL